MQPMTQRPANLAWPYLNPNHPLYRGLVFAGLGPHPGGYVFHDCSPYRNHGTLTNMDPATDWVWEGTLNRFALDFDATNDYVMLPDAIHRLVADRSEITLACFFKGSAAQSCIRLQLRTTSYIVLAWGATPTAIISTDGGTGGVSLSGANSGAQRHLAMTWKQNTTNGFRTYLDGIVLNQRDSANNTLPTYTVDIGFVPLLGMYVGSLTEPTNGRISDAFIYNRQLNPSEIQQLADPSNVMLSGLILPPRRKLWTVAGAPATTRKRQLIGGGIC